MTLLERMNVATACAVLGCDRKRVPDAAVCRDDLADLWANRLLRQPDGTYRRRYTVPARDLTWSPT